MWIWIHKCIVLLWFASICIYLFTFPLYFPFDLLIYPYPYIFTYVFPFLFLYSSSLPFYTSMYFLHQLMSHFINEKMPTLFSITIWCTWWHIYLLNLYIYFRFWQFHFSLQTGFIEMQSNNLSHNIKQKLKL